MVKGTKMQVADRAANLRCRLGGGAAGQRPALRIPIPYSRGFVLVFLFLSLAPSAFAQVGAQRAERAQARDEPQSFVNQQRGVDERIRSEFESEIGAASKTAFDWGGWYSLNLMIFDDGVESSRTLRRHDMQVWGRYTMDGGAHDFYARTRLSFIDFNSGDSYDGNDDDVEGPNLERGVYRFNLAKALEAYEGRSIDWNLLFSGGRDLVQFGTGLSLSMKLDHVAATGVYENWELTGMLGKSVGSEPDIDLSRTATRMHRNFIGTQLVYTGYERHRPFAYVLWQRDHNSEEYISPLQDYDYDSNYMGIGSTGELVRRLRYSTELIYETGHSYGHRQFIQDNDIEAWAYDAELEYLFPGEHLTRASVEYLFGSGDGERFASPTDSVGGNLGDRKDTSFVGFGYRDTGLSFAPLYSNLHMWRAGGSFFPWPQDEQLRELELGTDWYLYYKHHRDGAVSDPTADLHSGYLGWEMDYFLNWRMRADFAWTARFGTFFPGSAFDDQTTRTFFLIGMTWSF